MACCSHSSPILHVGTALVFFLVLFTTHATDEKCRSGCRQQSGPQTFKYVDGTTYKYNFDSKIEITLSSAEGQKTTTQIKADVLLTQQPQCNQIFRLQNVHIIGSDGKKHPGQIPDIDKPIQINFHDGHIEDAICATAGDTQNSLNIKRAIISIFQTNLKNGYETDVFGVCPTEINYNKEGANTVIVQKNRNLNKCAHRETIKQDFLSTAFNLNSEIKSSPILNSDWNAKLKIKNGILDNAHIIENYLYVPFSVGNNGAKAQIETKLQYTGQSKDNPPTKCVQRKSIIFDNPHPVNVPKSNINAILQAVKDATKSLGNIVSENTAKEFVNLVKVLRVSNKNDLLTVYNQVKAGVGFTDKATAKRLFLDALLRAGNGDNIEVAIELLKSNQLSELEKKFVYYGLSVVHHVTEKSLETAATLLSQPDLPREAYLGIGTLAGHYCRQHSCKNNDNLTKLLQQFTSKLGKITNRDEENRAITILKAIGNVNHINDDVVQKLVQLVQDRKQTNRLRVTVLETYQSDPCKDKIRESALSILKDVQQDSEIRIKAYLVLAQCPNAKIGNAIKQLLETEPSYQVGGFIVSHIKNIKSSANPDKELAKQHLNYLTLPKKYPIDFRRYSFNTEFSYAIDTLGLANSVEANLIYSQQSFLPRSSNVNLTAQIFGHTFNFLQVQTRQENFDKLLEHYLGPKGLLRSNTIQDLWEKKGKYGKEIYNDFKERLDKSLRAKRDLSTSDLEQAKKVVIKTNDLNRDLDLDFSVKLFGSEVLFVNFNDDLRKYTPETIVDDFINKVNDNIEKLKDFDKTVQSNLLFLDGEFSYPTMTGFPLRLGCEGSSNVQIKTKGNIDVRTVFSKDSNNKISVIPSVNVQIAGRLTLDTWLIENGLKIISNLHTSSGGDLQVEVFNGQKGIDVKFGLPVEKQNLISIQHDIVFHTRELGASEHNQPLKFAQNKDFNICLDQLDPIIGLTFCAELNGPNLSGKQVPVLPYPLAGDAKLAVTIEKNDVSQYHFRAVEYESSEKIGAEINVETINKKNEKKVSLQIEAFLVPDKVIRATLISPIKKALIEGKITTDSKEKSISAKFSHDNQEFYGKIGVSISGTDAKAVYKPILEYKTPQDQTSQTPPYNVQGQVIVEKANGGTKYVLDNVKLVIPNQKTVSFNGNFGQDGQAFYTDVQVSDGIHSGSIKGRLQAQPNHVKFNTAIENSVNPQANVNIKGEFKKSTEEYETSLQVIHGKDLNSKTNILTVASSVKYKRKNVHDFTIATKNKFSYPLIGVDAKFNYEYVPKKVKYDVNFQYNDVKVGSELDFKYNRKVAGDYDVDFELWGLGQRFEVETKRDINGDESTIANKVEVNDKKVEVNGKIKHHVKRDDINVGCDLTVKLPNENDPVKVQNTFIYNPQEVDFQQKITSGQTVYVDCFLKGNPKVGNLNGAVKINVKTGQITGQLKAQKGTGTGDILVDLPSLKKQLKADTSFTIQEPVYNLQVNIYPFYNEDKTKKFSVNFNNKLTANSLESKNSVEIFGKKFDFNAKGTHDGDTWLNSKTQGEIEIVPSNHYVLLKLNRDVKTDQNGLISGKGVVVFEYRENKNQQPGHKVSFESNFKNFKPKDNTIDGQFTLSLDNGKGKNVNIEWDVKRHKQDDATINEYKSKISGSVLEKPIETKSSATFKPGGIGQYSFETKCKYGQVTGNGNYDLSDGNSKPITGEFNIDFQSDVSKVVKNFKLKTSGSIHKTDYFEAKGGASISADSTEKSIVDISGNGELKISDKDGKIKGSVKYGKFDPLTLDVSYSRQENEKTKNIQSAITVEYGKNKQIKSNINLVKLPDHEYKFDVKLDLPTEKHHSNHLVVHTKRNPDNNHLKSDVELTSDGKKWTLNSDLLLSELTPTINIQSKCPDGKLVQFYTKVSQFNDKQIIAEVKIVNEHKDFIFESGLDGNFENVDDFHIKANIHCPVFHLDKIQFDAQNKATAKTGGRKIQVNVKSNGKNLLTGNTSYQSREEKGKLIVEGSGSFKVKEETKSANFKYIRQNLSKEKNGETGLEISFDAGLGNKAIDAELKVTNKQIRILKSYCEEKKQCAHIEFDAKTNIDKNLGFNQEIELAIDLRKLGLSHEFGLKSVTNRKDFILDHTVDIHFQSDENSKYQYSIFFHQKDAGISLTTPKRIVALEGHLNTPTKQFLKEGGKISGEVNFYLDKKNQPNQKTALVGTVTIDPKTKEVNSEFKFTNPGLSRPLTAKSNTKFHGDGAQKTVETTAEFDIFAQANQKLIVNHKRNVDWIGNNNQKLGTIQIVSIKSSGLNIDLKGEEHFEINRQEKSFKLNHNCHYHVGSTKYESKYNWFVSPQRIQFLIKFLNIDIVAITSKLQLDRDHQVANSDIVIYGTKPLQSFIEVKNWNTIKFHVARKEKPQDKVQISSGFIPGQIADFRIEVVQNGAKTDLIHTTVQLDDANFLKSDYKLDPKNFQKLLIEPTKNDWIKQIEEVKKLTETLTEQGKQEVGQWTSIAKKAQPNLKPLKDYYVAELKKLKEEILSDKTIKDISEFIHNLIGAVSQAFGETFSHFNEFIENVVKAVQDSFNKICELFDKEVFPKVKEFNEKIAAFTSNILNRVVDITLTYIAKFMELIEKYQPQLKQISAAVGEVFQEAGRFVVKAYERIKGIVQQQWQQLYNEIKALPIFEEIKQHYKNFIENGVPNKEAIINTFKDVIHTIKDVIPNDQVKNVIQLISDYIEKKLFNQKVDDFKEIEKIIQACYDLVKNFINAIVEKQPEFSQDYWTGVPTAFTFNLLNKLPKLVAIRFSPLAYLLHEDAATPTKVSEFLLSFVNQPRNLLVPFPIYGIVVQGQHLFTFDGKHLTFPGNCNYILARDASNGNFTIIGKYTNGQLQEVTLQDKSGDFVTLKTQGQVTVNNQPSEFPARKATIAAFRNYERIEIVTDYGARIICGQELVGCSVTISGFYHGQIRGLLGNANNEPYDDFTLPNGKIVVGESDFGNAYKLGSACANVKTVDHGHHHGTKSPSCEKLFSWDSELRYCYPFVNNDNFKVACDHGISAGVKNTEHAISIGYVAACNHHGIPIRVPAQFVNCKNGDQEHELGDKFSVKTPNKAADIVLMVDTVKANAAVYKELVQPLVQQITNELGTKGITDVEFHLITWGGENKWPSHVTVNGGKLTFKGKAPNIKFSESSEQSEKLTTGCPKVDSFLEIVQSVVHDGKLALGLDLQARTYKEGQDYPFRSHAVRSVIAVVSKPCEVGRFLPLQILRTLFYRKKIINLNLITPFNQINLKDKHAKDIVGFNDNHVFTIDQNKKAKGGLEAYKDLQYSDFCVDFTVNNRGNVFVTNNFLQAKGQNKKQFVQITTHNIVEQLTNVEYGLDCECKYTTPYTASNVCHVVHSKEKESK